MKFRHLFSSTLILGLTTTAAFAQEEFFDEQIDGSASGTTPWLEGDYAFRDLGGVRATLEDRGVNFFGGYAVEVWGNVDGGLEQGAIYTGLLDFGLDLDLEKFVGWSGATFRSSWLWLSGRDASEDLVGNLFTISNIAGFNTLRAFELWLEQSFLDDRISLRIGQLSADEEFIISDTAGTFLNGTFGWPVLASEALPNSGPAYPLATLGARLAVHPTDWFSFLAAGFQGNPFAEDVNRHGFRWRLDEENGATFLAEAQFRWDDCPLPGTVKFGGFANTNSFKLANGSGDEVRGNFGFYGIVDQALYREPGVARTSLAPTLSKDGKSFKEPVTVVESSDEGLNAFARAGFTPQDRNFVGFYFDTGLAYTGLIPTRDNDVVGIAFGYADVTHDAAQVLFDEGSREVGYEIVLEATYDIEVTPWLHVQPDAQYIIRPGTTGDLENAFVVGGRASIVF